MVLSELTQGFQVDVPDTLAGMDDPVKKIIGLLETSSNDSRTIKFTTWVALAKLSYLG